MNIEIICPLYNAAQYIEKLNESLKKQKNVKIGKVSYILTKSKDNTENILKQLNLSYTIIEPKDFSHSLTREKVAMESNSDILVFITQDIEIRDENWLENLVSEIKLI